MINLLRIRVASCRSWGNRRHRARSRTRSTRRHKSSVCPAARTHEGIGFSLRGMPGIPSRRSPWAQLRPVRVRTPGNGPCRYCTVDCSRPTPRD
jgi:hypothetical protein